MTPLSAVFPAVTCSAQASMLTGALPLQHGIVGNGWYFRDLAEIWLWRQSNRPPGPWLHLREALLVVQHVLERGLERDATPRVPGRRAESAGHLLPAP